MDKIIETERLVIRPIKLSDKKFIIDLVNSEGWKKYIGDTKISDTIEAEKYIQKIIDTPNYYYNVFQLKGSNQPIGLVTFLKREIQSAPDFGFALLSKFEKNGYANEATEAYLTEIINKASYKKIIAITIPENLKSINLLEKLGFTFDHDFKRENEILSL